MILFQVPFEKWTCIGDVNRMKSQFKRGGGTVCLQNDDVWKAFRDSIDEIEPCVEELENLFDNWNPFSS